jgi:uncharacterized protein YhhL (DUF1145 family)
MRASVILAYIGLSCSCVLIAIWLTIAIIDLRSVRNVTIRLVAGIAIADVLGHTSAILTIGSGKYIGTRYCESLAAVASLDRFLYAFTNIAICYHLYQAIVQLKKPSFKSELAVWVAIVAVIAVLMVILHFLGVFSGTEGKRACNSGADNPIITKAVYGVTAILNLLTIISGVIATIVCHRYLAKWIEKYSENKISDSTDQTQFKEARLKATKRSLLYPLSALITLSTEVVLCVWMVIDKPPLILYTVNSIMLGFKGILTLLTFSLDQAVWKSIKSIYAKITDIQLQTIKYF